MRIRVLALYTDSSGNNMGVMDSEDGPLLFHIGPSQIRIIGPESNQLYKTVDQKYNTIESLQQCAQIIWDSIQVPPVWQESGVPQVH
jgi:hypothetical protein